LFSSKHINAEKTLVNTVITRCIDRNIFSKELFINFSVLTSRGIQKQYLKVCKESRRKAVRFVKEYCLVNNAELTGVITEFIGVNTEETPENDTFSTQRKEKESKEKKSKEKESEVGNYGGNSLSHSLDNQALELCQYYQQLKPGQSISAQLAALKVLIDMYSFDWVKEALQVTISNKNEYIRSYMEQILKNWKAEGHTVSVENTNSKSKAPPKLNPKNNFGNYSGQRKYDPEELRKQLLGRENSEEEVT
jgi:DnaD/phage-associated family protein